ncbi:diiron oxygenase [Aquihabitans sp. G128]|uniref:diiron oxygenase n=1 Tax=Aquihabitans sp. G128 TaxID=2849779 RepID=UPI001C245917|nr:diiron oxygenase [Aquihabitans sp. G128]QXC59631.1 diiron oxygenase [Aquihabitans sp. G128]
MGNAVVAERVERLNRISVKRVIEPDADLPGSVGDGQLLPDELLSVHGLGLPLTAEQRRTLSREEVASILDNGIRFEATLEAGFGLQVCRAGDITDPRVTYLLHEMGEETRHQRMFQRVIGQIEPQARNPLAGHWLMARIERFGTLWIVDHAALLYVMVLAGEEIPDLLQKLASEHPDTDPFLASVNRYHRQEEARHLAFARTMLPEVWAAASKVDRFQVHHVAPKLIAQMYAFLVHPGVYEQVGLDGWATWKAANKTPERLGLLRDATRPVLDALLEAGVVRAGSVPKAWRELCAVDRHGVPSD